MADKPAEIVGVATLFDGFKQAFARWQVVERASHDPAGTFIPLFEVLEWTACIDERLETKKWASVPHLRGFRCARLRTLCAASNAARLGDGEVRSWDEWKLSPNMMREPGAPDEWAWHEHLPDAKRTRFREDEPYYESHLAEQLARATLNLIRRLFLGQRRPHYPRRWRTKATMVRARPAFGLRARVARQSTPEQRADAVR
jgi:hypothetical protein